MCWKHAVGITATIGKRFNMGTWSNELIYGDRKQTKSRLKDNYGYCCMGVLCELKGVNFHYIEDQGLYFTDDGEGSMPKSQLLKEWNLNVDVTEEEQAAIVGLMYMANIEGFYIDEMIQYFDGASTERSMVLAKLNDAIDGADFTFIGTVIATLGWDVDCD